MTLSKENKRQMNKYELEVKETPDGDLYFNFPKEMLNDLGWKEGDDVKFINNKNGSFTIKKVKYKTIELDFDDDELLKYMNFAHEKGITFNELAEEAVKEMLIKSDFERECG
jgi:bifunctional DNA-binding transcriptional regulator/antitoxin component of YhaV-PrlF toxin-antitoxin module